MNSTPAASKALRTARLFAAIMDAAAFALVQIKSLKTDIEALHRDYGPPRSLHKIVQKNWVRLAII